MQTGKAYLQNRNPIMLRALAIPVVAYGVSGWLIRTIMKNPLHADLVTGAILLGPVVAVLFKWVWERLANDGTTKDNLSRLVSVVSAPLGAVFMILAWNLIPSAGVINYVFVAAWTAVVFVMLITAQAEKEAWDRVGMGLPAYTEVYQENKDELNQEPNKGMLFSGAAWNIGTTWWLIRGDDD